MRNTYRSFIVLSIRCCMQWALALISCTLLGVECACSPALARHVLTVLDQGQARAVVCDFLFYDIRKCCENLVICNIRSICREIP